MSFFDTYASTLSSNPWGSYISTRREDEEDEGNVKPVTQTIKTDPVTGEQTMTISGRPQDLSAANPYTPTVTGPGMPAAPVDPATINQQAAARMQRQQGVAAPVNPQDVLTPAYTAQNTGTYDRMLTAESGNQNYYPNGQPVVSPRGARYAAQVMPRTAADPGYGVRPAQADTPDEYNRVGREYYDAMLKKYNGDEALAAAAYNAGPGRVDQAVARARQSGGDWRQYVPGETQQYLAKVQPGVVETVAAAPSATVTDVSAAPVAPVAPTADMSAVNQQAAARVQRQESAAPDATWNAGQWNTHFYNNLQSPDAMLALSQNVSAPAEMRQAAAAQYQSTVDQQAQAQAAIDKIQKSANPNLELAKLTQRKDDEGSIIKAYVYHRLGLADLAKTEQQKLGAGQSWQHTTLQDGSTAVVKYDGTGRPIEGYTPEGAMSPAQLASVTGTKPAQVETEAGVYYDVTAPSGPKFTLVRKGANSEFLEVGTGRRATAEERSKLVKMSTAGSLDQQAQAAYLKGGATQQGVQAAQTGQAQGALPARVGAVEPTPLPAAPAAPAAQPVAPADIAQPPAAPAAAPAAAPTPAAAPAAVTAPAANLPGTQGYAAPAAGEAAPAGYTASKQKFGEPFDVYQQRLAREKAVFESNVRVAEGIRTDYQTKYLPDLNSKAEKNAEVGQLRRDISRIMLQSPQIVGILSGGGSAATEVYNILRDSITGDAADPEALTRRVEAVNFPDTDEGRKAKADFALMIQAQLAIAPNTLKEVAGAGTVTEFEQKANRDTIGDMSRLPIYAAFSINSKDQWAKDMKVAERDWAEANRNTIKSQGEHSSRWNAEKKAMTDAYNNIYRARAEYIKKYSRDNMKPNQAAGVVRDAFELYPVPEYNPETKKWEYPGRSAEVARPPLSNFKK